MNKVRNLVAVIDLVLLKSEVKERDKILSLINEIKQGLNKDITSLGTQRENIEKVNLQLKQLNKIDSILRSFSVSKRNELLEAKTELVHLNSSS